MKTLRFALTVSVLAILAGCFWGSKKEEQPMATKAGDAKIKVVNVLSKELFDDAHIKGSIHVEYGTLAKDVAGWDRATPIVVYCSSYMCTASGSAAATLKQLGFTDVKAYEGGMAEWYQLSQKDASYAVEGPAKQEYLTVVVKKPAQRSEEVVEISAEALKELLTAAGLL